MKHKIWLSLMPVLLEFGIIGSFIATIIGVHAIKVLLLLGFSQFTYIVVLALGIFIANQLKGVSKFINTDKDWLTSLSSMWLLTLLMLLSAMIVVQ